MPAVSDWRLCDSDCALCARYPALSQFTLLAILIVNTAFEQIPYLLPLPLLTWILSWVITVRRTCLTYLLLDDSP